MSEPRQEESRRRRRRGVRASRVRLIQALARAGLKNQTALAERMADAEGLESAPRHLVNRVFRELPVDPLSLERVANALGVAAHTLYLTQREAQAAAPNRLPPHPGPDRPGSKDAAPGAARSNRRRRLIFCAAVGAALTAPAGWLLNDDARVACEFREWLWPPHVDDGRLGVAIGRFENDPENLGQAYLYATLRSDHVLMRHLSVLTICRPIVLPAGENTARQTRRVDAVIRRLLRRTNAQVLIWGRIDENRLRVHFAANRRDLLPAPASTHPIPGTAHGQTAEIALTLSHPGNGIDRIKLTALRLMQPGNRQLRQLRRRMIQTYAQHTSEKARSISRIAVPGARRHGDGHRRQPAR